MSHQFDCRLLLDKKNQRFDVLCDVLCGVVMMKDDATISVCSTQFIYDFWQTNCCIPINIYCPSIL